MEDVSKHKLVLIVMIIEFLLLFFSYLLTYFFNIPIFSKINVTISDSLVAIVAFIFMSTVNFLVIFVLPKYVPLLFPLRLAYNSVSIIVKDLDIVTIILVALITGLSEEIFFRGCLQPLIGIVFTSFIFGLCHLADKKTIPYGIYAVLIGFYLGYLYEYTNNLWLPILVHVLNNALAIPIMKWNAKKLSI